MAKSKRLPVLLTGLILSLSLVMETGMSVQAGSNKNLMEPINGGVAAILDPGATNTSEVIGATARELNLTASQTEAGSNLAMANVKDALNVRSEASEESDKVGKLYKDCGGTILERKGGWTKLQSGNMIGWCKDEYLLFEEEAETLANDVGKLLAYGKEALWVRMEPSTEAESYGILSKGEPVEVMEVREDGWIYIAYDSGDGYVLGDYVTLSFMIDKGETLAEIKARQAAEKEAKRHVNYGEYTTDADTAMLLAALIQCEAGGESYEGQLAVGAVVMNRVRSGAYPDSIHGVIYASGQFTPALNGKLNRLYESGKISSSCIKAAQEAIAGASNVGDLTHFRRNNGRSGLVIGNHVFY